MTTTIHQRGTFDEDRETPRTCPCGKHTVTGHWTRLHCPWQPPIPPGRWGIQWQQEGGDA